MKSTVFYKDRKGNLEEIHASIGATNSFHIQAGEYAGQVTNYIHCEPYYCSLYEFYLNNILFKISKE
jgi:hypothetical protein